jgi:hypothetical protein
MRRGFQGAGRRGSTLVPALIVFVAVLAMGVGLLRLELALLGYPVATCVLCVLAATFVVWLSCHRA